MFKLLVLSLTMLAGAGTALLASEPQTPDAALRSTVDQLVGNLKQHSAQYRKDQRSFYAMVDQVVVPRFDVPGIARFALGKHGRTATPDQRQRFADALALTLVHSYANVMLDRYDSMILTWNPVRTEAGADRVKIDTMLKGDAGEQYPVGFYVRRVDGDWKIYDLEIGGISLALNYRAQLSAEIKRTSLEAAIGRMTKQDSQASAVSAL